MREKVKKSVFLGVQAELDRAQWSIGQAQLDSESKHMWNFTVRFQNVIVFHSFQKAANGIFPVSSLYCVVLSRAVRELTQLLMGVTQKVI